MSRQLTIVITTIGIIGCTAAGGAWATPYRGSAGVHVHASRHYDGSHERKYPLLYPRKSCPYIEAICNSSKEFG
jgi:hypothetical protein